jgi:hypothetical protein
MSTTSEKTTSFDPARRRLCPDGTCIGLLDETGRCKECGLVAGGGKASAAPLAAPVSADVEPEGQEDEPDEEQAMEAAGEGEPKFDPARRLCPDGSCVGVLGADGRCPVCGQTAAS